MLVLNNISFEFGSRYLFKDTSWHIKPKEKYGLIGPNGTGKSTLLRVIAGEYSLSGGEMTGRRDLSIGFLNQDLLSYESENNILHVAMEAFEKENDLHDKIEAILENMENDHSEAVLDKLHNLQTQFEALDGYTIQHKAEAILEGLGFETKDLHRPLKEFSGGWRMRVMLAKILLKKPDLLLLDEPTNHLDLPSIQWLEGYLEEYDGAFIIVSHDRFFLDKVVTKIAEVSSEKINLYSGNYSFYLEEKHEREELQRSQFKNQQKHIKEQERLIDRFRAKASKAKMAQSRIKMLERLERVEDVDNSTPEIKINLNFSIKPGRSITNIHIDEKKYSDQEIFKNTDVKIERGDKIALIGANGKGKSTLLRIINNSEPFKGKHELGYNVVKSFYAQHQLESLNLDNSMLVELQQWAPEVEDVTLRTLLGAFLFNGDDVFKKIKVLSGGEKARVALAKTILSKSNFLLLDEPTNHLDMTSVNILIKVLKKYEGSYLAVSHDRFFLSQIANKIWYIKDKELKEYPGSYQEYEYFLEQQKNLPKEEIQKEAVPKKEVIKENDPSLQNDKERKKEENKLKQSVKALEEKINTLKAEKESLLVQMADTSIINDSVKIKEVNKKYQSVEQNLKLSTAEWEECFNRLIEFSEEK